MKKTPAIRPEILGLALTVMCAVAYGFSWPGARASYAHGANNAFVILAVTVTRTLGLLLACLVRGKGLYKTAKDIRLAFTGGFFQSLSLIGSFTAMLYLPAPVAAILLFTHTLMLLFFMAWRGQAHLDAAALVTTVCALVGLGLVLDVRFVPVSLPGLGLGLMSAVATMSRLYVYGQQTKTRDPAVVGAETFLVALLVMSALALIKTPVPPTDATGYAWVAGTSLVNALGTVGMFYAISLIGAFRFSLFLKLEPVFAALFSALLIGEFLHWSQYMGIAAVIGSLAAYQYMSQRAGRSK
jgi:drug/metabolite transporter (DMT)-like permease